MKKSVLMLLTLGLALGAGLSLRHMASTLTGQAVGDGVDAIDVIRVHAGHAWTPTQMTGDMIADAAVFGQITGVRDATPATVRVDGGSVMVQSPDGGAHGREVVELLALRGDPRALGLPAEIGSVTVSIAGHDTRVDLDFVHDYVNPVVFAQVAGYGGADPIAVRADDVTGVSAVLVVDEPPAYDGYHAPETIHYAVVEAGVHALPDGRVVEVGTRAVTTTGPDDFDGVQTTTIWYDDAAFVTTVQAVDRAGYVHTRVEKGGAGHDILRHFGLRFMRAPGEENSTTTGTIGYLALGTPWTDGPGRIRLFDGDAFRGWDFARRPHGTCYDLHRAGFADRVDRTRVTAHRGRVTVTLYTGRSCTGDRNTIDTTTTMEKQYGNYAGKADSFRVSWTDAVAITTPGTWTDGETLLENDSAVLAFEDGSLTLYKKSNADRSLWPVWSKGDGNGVEVEWTAGGNLAVRKPNGSNAWASGTGGINPGSITLHDNCNLAIYNAGGTKKWGAGTGDCHKGAPAPAHAVDPGMLLGAVDLDHDGDAEMVLMVTAADGSGGLFYDPLSIADMLITLGVGLSDDFWYLLSPTQQAALLDQMAPLGGRAPIERVDLEDAVRMFNQQNVRRDYDVIHYTGRAATSDAVYQGSDSVGPYQGTITVGAYEVMVENDEYGPGFEISYTHAQVEITNGTVAVGAVAGQASAAANVDRNGYTVGAQYTLIGAYFAVGNPDGSYVGFDVGVGSGVWLDYAMGRNGQYGYAVAVPGLPVGIAIYVAGDDVRMVWGQVADFGATSAGSIAELSERVWGYTVDAFEQVEGSLTVAMHDTADEVRVSVDRGVDYAVIVAGDVGEVVVTHVDKAGAELAQAVSDGMAVAGDAIVDGADAVGDALTGWASNTPGVAAQAVGGVVSGAKWVGNKIKFW